MSLLGLRLPVRFLLGLALAILASGAATAAPTWVDYATVSMTDVTTPKLTANRLCYTDGTDLACDGAAGLLITSGTASVLANQLTGLLKNW